MWNEKDSIVLTSATLTTAGEFDYLRRGCMLESADEVALGSPFDYETSTLLYLVNDIPEPADRLAYQHESGARADGIVPATARSDAGALHFQRPVAPHRPRHERPLGPDRDHVSTSKTKAFRATRCSSRFGRIRRPSCSGTRSFWEGVDVPGEALSVVVMVRLPFDVPTDPIVSARAETYDSPFDQYSLPEAILRFRQGFGRLIRTKSDRGAVVILDRRILTKRYGPLFLKSLPTCTQRQGPLREAPRDVARWLGV